MTRRMIIIAAFLAAVTGSFFGGYYLVEVKEIEIEIPFYVDREVEVEVPVYVEGDIDSTFDEVMQDLIDNHFSSPTKEELWQGALEGMITTLDDPHTSYFDYEEYQQYSGHFGDTYVGIGVAVKFFNGTIVIEEVKSNSPALASGIQVNDIITHVDNVDITADNLYETIDKILGEVGTDVIVGVIRAGFNEVIHITMTRAVIENPTVTRDMFLRDGKLIGYIKVNVFGDETATKFTEAIDFLEGQGMEGLIVDLRNNGGGRVDTVDKMLQEFLIDNGKQMFVTEGNYDSGYARFEYEATRLEKRDYDILTLVNEGSASASEVFASAMQEHGMYPVYGTVTYGKGTMQQTKPMLTTIVKDVDGNVIAYDSLHITIGKWKTSNENWVHGVGVTPDTIIERTAIEKAFKTFVGDDLIMSDVVDARVANIQLILNTMGYTVRTDGYFDTATENAVRDIQLDNGITETGNIDSDTMVFINAALGVYLNDKANDTQLQAGIDYFVD